MNILTEPVHFFFPQIEWVPMADILLYVFTVVILHTAALFLRKCCLSLGFSWTQGRGFEVRKDIKNYASNILGFTSIFSK